MLRRRKAEEREWKNGGMNGEENRCESGVEKGKVRMEEQVARSNVLRFGNTPHKSAL